MSVASIGAGLVVSGIAGGMLGGSGGSESGDSNKEVNIKEDSTTTKSLEISDEAIDKIIADILGSETGIADIFAKEKVAGLYNSTVSTQAAGDLLANLAGEIAKLRAVETETTNLTRRELTQGEFDNETGASGSDVLSGISSGISLYKGVVG